MAYRLFRRRGIRGAALRSPVTRKEAKRIVTEVYAIVLRRAPDAEGLEAFVGHLCEGRLTQLGMVKAIIESREFSENVVRLPKRR